MNSLTVSVWILMVAVQCCMSSTSLSSGSTIHPSLEQSIRSVDSTSSTQETVLSSYTSTLKSTQTFLSPTTKLASPVTARTPKLSFSSSANTFSDLTISGTSLRTSLTPSHSEYKSESSLKTTYESMQPSSTTIHDSVIKNGTSFSNNLQSTTSVQIDDSLSNTLPLSAGAQLSTSSSNMLQSSTGVQFETMFSNTLPSSTGVQLETIFSTTLPSSTGVQLDTSFNSNLPSSTSVQINLATEKLSKSLNTESNGNMKTTSTKTTQLIMSNQSSSYANIESNVSVQKYFSTSTNITETSTFPFSSITVSSNSAVTPVSSEFLAHSSKESFTDSFISSSSTVAQISSSPSVDTIVNTVTDSFYLSSELYTSVVTKSSFSVSVPSSMSSVSVILQSVGYSSETNLVSPDLSSTSADIVQTSSILPVQTILDSSIDQSERQSNTIEPTPSATTEKTVMSDSSRLPELPNVTSSATIFTEVYSTQITPTPASKSFNLQSSEVLTSTPSRSETDSVDMTPTVLSIQSTSSKIGSLDDSVGSTTFSTPALTASDSSGKSNKISLSGTSMLLQETSLYSHFNTTERTSPVSEFVTELRSHFSKTGNTDMSITLSTWDSATVLTSVGHVFISPSFSEDYSKSSQEYESLSSSEILHRGSVQSRMTTSTFLVELHTSESSSLNLSDIHATLSINNTSGLSGSVDGQTVPVTERALSSPSRMMSESSVMLSTSDLTTVTVESDTESEHSFSYLSSTHSSLLPSFLQPSEHPVTSSSLSLTDGAISVFSDSDTVHTSQTLKISHNLTFKTETDHIPKTISSASMSISSDDVSFSGNTRVGMTESSITSSFLQTTELKYVLLNSSSVTTIEDASITNEFNTNLLYSRTSITFSSTQSLADSMHVFFTPTVVSTTSQTVLSSFPINGTTSVIDLASSVNSSSTRDINDVSMSPQIEPTSSSQYTVTSVPKYSELTLKTNTSMVTGYISNIDSSSYEQSYTLTSVSQFEHNSSSTILKPSFSSMEKVESASANIVSSSSSQFDFSFTQTPLMSRTSEVSTTRNVTMTTMLTDSSIVETKPISSSFSSQTFETIASSKAYMGTSTLMFITDTPQLLSSYTDFLVETSSLGETFTRATFSHFTEFQSRMLTFLSESTERSDSSPVITVSQSISSDLSDSSLYEPSTMWTSIGAPVHSSSTATMTFEQNTSSLTYNETISLSSATLSSTEQTTVTNMFTSMNNVGSGSDTVLSSSESAHSFIMSSLLSLTTDSVITGYKSVTHMLTGSFGVETKPISSVTSLQTDEASVSPKTSINTSNLVTITSTPHMLLSQNSSLGKSSMLGTEFLSMSYSVFTNSESILTSSTSKEHVVNSQISELTTDVQTTKYSLLYETSKTLTSSNTLRDGSSRSRATLVQTTPSLSLIPSISYSSYSTEKPTVSTEVFDDSESISFSTNALEKTFSRTTIIESSVHSDTGSLSTTFSDITILITSTTLFSSLTTLNTTVISGTTVNDSILFASTKPKTNIPNTTVTSTMAHSVSSALQSPQRNFSRSTSLHTVSSSKSIFVTSTGMQLTTLEPSTESFSRLTISLVSSPVGEILSTATLSFSVTPGTYSTAAFNTTENTSVHLETSLKMTSTLSSSTGIQTLPSTTYHSFGAGNNSMSSFTELLTSFHVTSTTFLRESETLVSKLTTSLSQETLLNSVFNVSSISLSTLTYSPMSSISSPQLTTTFVSNNSSTTLNSIETGTSSQEITNVLTQSFLTHSKTPTGTQFISSTSLVEVTAKPSSVVESSILQSSELDFSTMSTVRGTDTMTSPSSTLSSLSGTTSFVLGSVESRKSDISSTVVSSILKESLDSVTSSTSIIRLESSIFSSSTQVNLYTTLSDTSKTLMNETLSQSKSFTNVISPTESFMTFKTSSASHLTVSNVSALTSTTSEVYSSQTTSLDLSTISYASVTDTHYFKASTSSVTHFPSSSILSTESVVLSVSVVSAPSSKFYTSSTIIGISSSQFHMSSTIIGTSSSQFHTSTINGTSSSEGHTLSAIIGISSSEFHTPSPIISTSSLDFNMSSTIIDIVSSKYTSSAAINTSYPVSLSESLSDNISSSTLKSSSEVTSSTLQTFDSSFTLLSSSISKVVSSPIEASSVTPTPASSMQDGSSVRTDRPISTIGKSMSMTATSASVESTKILSTLSSTAFKSVTSDLKMSSLKPTPASSVKSSSSGIEIISATVNESSTFMSTLHTSTTTGLINITGIDISTTSFSPSLSRSSVTSSTLVVTSSIVSTTTEPPTVTTLNATNAREANWVRTVLKILRSKNISDPRFVRELEQNFASAYKEAFIRQKLIEEGKFQHLQRRRRRKRYTSDGDASVNIHELSRVEDTSTVAAIYAVEKSGEVLSAEEAVAALDVLDTQELAIVLKQVVAVKAEPYTETEKPVEPDEDTSQLWLIGVIAGSVAGGIIVIWVIVCIYCKCCRHKDAEEDDAEPELTSIRPQTSKRKTSHGRPLPSSPPPKKTLVSQGSNFILRKGRTYEINDAYSPEVETEDQKLLNSHAKKKPPSPKTINGSAAVTPVLPKRELVPPSAKKGRRNSRNSIGPLSGEYDIYNDVLKGNSSKGAKSQLFQSSVSEDSEDVKKQLKADKKKNKERFNELYGQEFGPEVEYKKTTENKILGMPITSVPSFVIESGSPAKELQTSPRRHSDGNTSGDENLQEARSRMHKLLDDAFSLISPRESFTENDLRKLTTSTHTLGDKSTDVNQSNMSVADIDKGFTNPAYTSSYSEFLETWSPYRASDQVALISMPFRPEPAVTKLGSKPDKRQAMSKTEGFTGRRPAAHLDQIGSKNMSEISGQPKYTTSSPKPILLRTKDDVTTVRGDSARSNKASNSLKNNRTISATAFNGDVLIQGSGTSLTKTGLQAKDATNGLIEMQSVGRNRSNSIRKHRVPEKDNRNRDEVDVIQNIRPEETTDSMIKSLRNEIKNNKIETEDDINNKPIKRRNRKTHSKPMTDIV